MAQDVTWTRGDAPEPRQTVGDGVVRAGRDMLTRHAGLACIVGLTALAFGLRLSQIHQGLFGDELFTYGWTAGSTPHVGNADNPPLFFLLAWLAARLGDPTVTIRLPSLLLGTATVPVIFVLGRQMAGDAAGVFAAALFALDPFAIFYGVEGRPYATMVFCVALSTLAVVQASRTHSWRWWALYTVAVTGATYSHFSSIFVIGTQALWSLWACRARLREPLLANALAVLLYLPWLSHVHGHQTLNIIAVLGSLHFTSVISDILSVFGGYPFVSLRHIPTVPLFVVLLGLSAVSVLALVIALQRGRLRALRSDMVLLGLTAIATPVGLLLYSLLVVDIWGSRQLLASLPAVCVLVGAGWAVMPRGRGNLMAAGALAVMLVGSLISFAPTYRRPDLPAIARYIEAHSNSPTTVVFAPVFTRLDIYLPSRIRVVDQSSRQQVARISSSNGQLFIVAPIINGRIATTALGVARTRHLVSTKTVKGQITYAVLRFER